MKYRITVLMGIYNCASSLDTSLNSLLAQTYQGFKVIMCDDGSNDNTYQIAKEYSDKYENFILIQNEKNLGLNYTLNHCLKLADTEYCARMDGDDINLPERFEKEIEFLDEHPEYVIVGCSMIYFDEQGDYRTTSRYGDVNTNDFLVGTPFAHPTILMRTEALKSVGGYSVADNLIRVEDYHLWFKMYSKGYKGYNMREILYRYKDDRSAYNRRTFKARKNEAYVMFIGFKMLQFPLYTYIYCLKPIILHFLPNSIYRYIHKNRL